MVQNAMERTSIPGRNHDTAKIANFLVAQLWEDIPTIIAAKKPKATNFALAIGALTNGLHRAQPGSEAEDALFLALGRFLQSPKAATASSTNQADAYLIEHGLELYVAKGAEKGLIP